MMGAKSPGHGDLHACPNFEIHCPCCILIPPIPRFGRRCRRGSQVPRVAAAEPINQDAYRPKRKVWVQVSIEGKGEGLDRDPGQIRFGSS
jgi:hypothetical protein